MSKTIFERIELERRGKEPNEVTELNLDNCRGLAEVDEELRNSLNKFDNMECLSLINANLSSVKNFPSLPKLKKLELSDNRVSCGLDNIVKSCPNITHLSLSGNKIADYEALKVLSNLSSLRSLDLFNCEVTVLDEYREKVFEMLPNLEFLDGYDRDDKEDLEDDEYGDMDGEADPDADDADVEVDEDDEDDDDENDDLDDEEDELGDEEEEGEVVGLDYLQKDNLELDSEGEDFNPDDEDEEEDVTVEDGDDDDDEEEQSRGKKRKLEGEGDGDPSA